MSRPRLLLVEDDMPSARSFARLLQTAVDVVLAASLAEAEVLLRAPGELAVVWSDRHLVAPDDGCRVLAAARVAHPRALLLLVTGTVDAPGLEALPSRVAVFEKTRAHEAVDWVIERLGTGR
jgi:ActR/RegA family two-component response regulator